MLCKLPEDLDPATEEQLGTDLLQCRDVASAQFTDTLSESFNNSIQSINSIVVGADHFRRRTGLYCAV